MLGDKRNLEPMSKDDFEILGDDPMSRDLPHKYRDRYNQYRVAFDSEEYCDNRATDSRSYTERRKKTVRFNSEGWDTVDINEGLDPPMWTSASNVYYDDHCCPPCPPAVGGIQGVISPPGGGGGQMQHQPQDSLLSGGRRPPPHWSIREFPITTGRKDHWEVERQESQDSQTKDSGIDSGTSSNFNSSEDSSKGDTPRVYRVCIVYKVCIVYTVCIVYNYSSFFAFKFTYYVCITLSYFIEYVCYKVYRIHVNKRKYKMYN